MLSGSTVATGAVGAIGGTEGTGMRMGVGGLGTSTCFGAFGDCPTAAGSKGVEVTFAGRSAIWPSCALCSERECQTCQVCSLVPRLSAKLCGKPGYAAIKDEYMHLECLHYHHRMRVLGLVLWEPGCACSYQPSRLNPLPTNDAHIRHGLSISHKNLYGGFNTRHYTLLHGFWFF